MTINAMTVATTKVYVAVGQTPATFDKAGYDALTWTLIPDVTSLGTFGGTNSVTTHLPIDDGQTYKFAGSTDSGQLSMNAARTTAAAFDDLRTAFASRLPTPFKVVYPVQLAETDAMMGIVTSVQTTGSDSNSILGLTLNVDITGAIATFAT